MFYSKNDRTTSRSLPVSMTLVGCSGSEERLIDCVYHDFIGSQANSMDVSISCGSSTIESTTDSTSDSTSEKPEATVQSVPSSESTASLSIAVISIIAIVIMASILVAVFIRNYQKKIGPTR